MERTWVVRLAVAALAAGTALTVGCGKKEDKRPTRPEAVREAPTPGGQAPTQLLGTSTITGVVKYIGAPRRRESLNNLMGADKVCAAASAAGPVLDETFMIDGDTGAVKNVFVYVKNAPKGKYAAPTDEKVLDQKGCVYIPHALALQTNQTLNILNSDRKLPNGEKGTTHNVHSLAQINEGFNESMTPALTKLSKKFPRQEIFKIKCDVHDWMGAFVGVFEHPFFAVTAEDGSFSIGQLPAGTYTLTAYHEKLKEVETTVTVTEGGEQTVELSFGG